MFKGFVAGLVLGVVLLAGAAYLDFSTGRAPVAVTDPPFPLEKRLARLGLHARLDRAPHPDSPLPADEPNLVSGAAVYVENCAVCHGLPGKPKTAIAAGLYPPPPELFRGTGVTDDPAWETYWKAANGIRLTGMPGFRGTLTDAQLWQVANVLAHADKLPDSAKKALGSVP